MDTGSSDSLALEQAQVIYSGPRGYASLCSVQHEGRSGLLLHYRNPDPRKLHAVDGQGMLELSEALAAAEQLVQDADAAVESATASGEPHPDANEMLSFIILYGDYDPLHAGADITEFAGEPDFEAIRNHMLRGVEIDARIKKLYGRLRSVGVFCGERFGGSVEWPLFAELRICDSATRIQFSEVHLGIVPGWDGILNVMLHSSALNAEYMCCTGNAVNAQQMLAAGLVQAVVDAPPAPSRTTMAPKDYAAAWKAHAEECQQALLAAALELACGAVNARAEAEDLCSEDALGEELNRRCDFAAYAALRQQVAAEAAGLDPSDGDALKALNKRIASELSRLGKPLAPEAVQGVRDFVERWRGLSRERLLERFYEAGREEAELISRLMHTAHRRTGVNAVLSKTPAERVPVFD